MKYFIQVEEFPLHPFLFYSIYFFIKRKGAVFTYTYSNHFLFFFLITASDQKIHYSHASSAFQENYIYHFFVFKMQKKIDAYEEKMISFFTLCILLLYLRIPKIVLTKGVLLTF